MRARPSARSLFVAIGLGLLNLGSTPAPKVLVFAGGWGPAGNQASIEADARALSVAFEPRPRLLYARGDRSRTVQIARAPDPVAARLGLLFEHAGGWDVDYRRPVLEPHGPATSEALLAELSRLAHAPGGAVVFGAGHGSRAEESPGQWELWGGPLPVPEVARALDAAKPTGPLTFVLGQCHSGAFAAIAHVGGDTKAPLATPTRCVLAAVPPELEAAGCSPDVNDPSARAFLATLLQGLATADYDNNGTITLDEAFSFARIHDRTVDVPVRSSELWLAARGTVRVGEVTAAQLRAWAEPVDRAALEALNPDGQAPADIERGLDARIGEAESLDAKLVELEGRFDTLRAKVRDQLLSKWPELEHPFHPKTRALLAGAAEAVMRWWDGQAEARALEALSAKLTKMSEGRWALERVIAREDRYVRLAQSVVAARSLDAAARRDWAKLRACEQRAVKLAREAPRTLR